MDTSITKILLFGLIAEKCKCEFVLLPDVTDTDVMIKKLIERFPFLQEMKYSLAVNRGIVHSKVALNSESEVALLPPFSGG